MIGIQPQLDYADSVARWLAELGREQLLADNTESGLLFSQLAASIQCRQCRTLSTSAIESNMLMAAQRLKTAHSNKQGDLQAKACLHVLDEALPAGGLTAMATRWIVNEQKDRKHYVALLSQQAPVPDSLLNAVSQTGGEVFQANPNGSLVERAAWLRALAWEKARDVVLHVDLCDVISETAFGVPGGPRVMLVNHAAHLHWIGVSVADLLINCRGSALEGEWAEKYRGTPRFATVPIPLDETAISPETRMPDEALRRRPVRERLGVADNQIVILSVGASFKYLPVDELDFIKSCERVLGQVANAVVLVAGFKGDERWQNAGERTVGRIRTLGRLTQEELAEVRATADIYIEGFPFGTTTSLLEAGLNGVPAVLAPAECPPPFGSDGVALDHILKRPQTIADYEREIIRLAASLEARKVEGERLRSSILHHHTGAGWREHLAAALKALPEEHKTYSPEAAQQTPLHIHERWFRFQAQWNSGYEYIFENVISNAFRAGLKPRITPEMGQAYRQAAWRRAHGAVPLPILLFLCHSVLPRLPGRCSARVFSAVVFVFRKALFSRIVQRIGRMFGRGKQSVSPYAEYRQKAVR